jgi:hypothetical protein
MSHLKIRRRISAASLLVLSGLLFPMSDLEAGERWCASRERATVRGFSWNVLLAGLMERAGAWTAGNPAVNKEGAQIDGNGGRRKDVIVDGDGATGPGSAEGPR